MSLLREGGSVSKARRNVRQDRREAKASVFGTPTRNRGAHPLALRLPKSRGNCLFVSLA